MTNRSEELVPHWNSVRLVERFSSVLYPLDLRELLHRLPSIGWVVPQQEVTIQGDFSLDRLPTKGNVRLAFNQENKTIGVYGEDPSKIAEEFIGLREFWLKELSPEPMPSTHYVELGGNGWIKGKSNPIEVLSNVGKSSPKIKQTGAIIAEKAPSFGESVSTYNLRLVKSNSLPTDPNWSEITIAPINTSSQSRYHINVVWRKDDVNTMIEAARGINELVKSVISSLEREN